MVFVGKRLDFPGHHEGCCKEVVVVMMMNDGNAGKFNNGSRINDYRGLGLKLWLLRRARNMNETDDASLSQLIAMFTMSRPHLPYLSMPCPGLGLRAGCEPTHSPRLRLHQSLESLHCMGPMLLLSLVALGFCC